ncbi:hypothetical protein A3I36_04610 [Candidatus Giovannonibacteria bacterium RIFCSPLOWO2_02_FULL_45_28]|uniref:Vitamin K epoxide reductase domain-containing protein n=1 Tax=Candidatus Giovannonibacteria bacterium RIFCSPHIGHO2_02_FULL_45_40 TaxID=1798337 RepID=A0A1F5WB86_9BACT|nr:MAG: hypothetical protein A2120_04735 [Candidatus Giovannonibacteria bacterium GWA2_45_15]OGF60489.1 MAG: hypothetical protein A2W40_03225 [Candidatus Giovannonibacteria bacterium RIFCSPHIGHO2_01_45_12]OGF72912.1 MAG: hypothetical protein A3C05_03750 [Candidatus Giovannonibacteria bacterium RIFCSPHIGHO2_02_FULL_45_40]OGF84889.1 MAG: hypothetical protein A3E63_04295 [Candidatus Giovannonibacteria bacterium RIFCSPHIGHO2_12_FULL_45_19]OGF85309.1 MAG: hypothetical protein A3A19_01145 [Candidatus
MKNLKTLSFLTLSLIGFLDASYLAVKHYLGEPVVCSLLEGCEEVLTSKYAIVAGVPVALFGVFYYLAVFILIILYWDTGKTQFLRFAAYLTILGFAASLWFVYLQLFVIGAICLYCMASAITSTILFMLGLFIIFKTGL